MNAAQEAIIGRARRRVALTNKIAIVIGPLIAIWVAGCVANMALSIRFAPEQLRKRHREATAAINHVYACFDRAGHWPSEDDMAQVIQQLPDGWSYYADPDGQYANLSLHGPFHMVIYYRFEPPGVGPLSKRWRLSNEGSKSEFTAEVAYSPVLR